MKGNFGSYLDVSFTEGKIRDYQILEEWYEKFLGGRGIGARILYEELQPKTEPLAPETPLVFATGPFQGLKVPGAGRHVVMAKSPKTGAVSGSYVGGFFG